MKPMIAYPILAVLAAVGVLLGCSKTSNDERAYDPAVYVDRATGCQYLAPGFDSRSALTPRMATDGRTHVGCKGVRP